MQQLNLRIDSNEIDAVAVRRSTGRLIGQRPIGDLPWFAVLQNPGAFTQRPDLVVVVLEVVPGLEYIIFAIGGPASATLRGWLAPAGQQRMRIGAVGFHFP